MKVVPVFSLIKYHTMSRKGDRWFERNSRHSLTRNKMEVRHLLHVPAALTFGKRSPILIRGWVDARFGMDVVEKIQPLH